MTAIARTIRTRIPLFSFTSRGLLSFLLVAGLLLAIFFLPDLAGIHASRSRVETAISDGESRSQGSSPLSAILEQLNQNSDRKPFAPSIREAANQAIREAPAVTWDVIRSEPVKLALTRARNEVGQIIDSVPVEKSFSRFALANYQLALEQLSASKDDRFRATDALAYLRYLDREVTARLEEEGVEGVALKRWSEVTLGDALKNGEERVYREGNIAPFDPMFSLNHIQIKVPADGAQKPNTQFAPSSTVSLEGSLLYRGVKNIKVYHNRKLVKEIPVPRPSKHSTDRFAFFRTSIDAASGVFAFRVESEDREVYIKEYSFYPRLLSIAPKNPYGQYVLGRGRERTLALDQKFLRSVSRPRTEEGGMVPF